jgi:hypothetical protein
MGGEGTVRACNGCDGVQNGIMSLGVNGCWNCKKLRFKYLLFGFNLGQLH